MSGDRQLGGRKKEAPPPVEMEAISTELADTFLEASVSAQILFLAESSRLAKLSVVTAVWESLSGRQEQITSILRQMSDCGEGDADTRLQQFRSMYEKYRDNKPSLERFLTTMDRTNIPLISFLTGALRSKEDKE